MLLRTCSGVAIPGGWSAAGSSGARPREDALRREVAEETALTVRVGPLFQVRRDRLRLAVEAVYLCRLEGGAFRPSNEVTEIQWRARTTSPGGCTRTTSPSSGRSRAGWRPREASLRRAYSHFATSWPERLLVRLLAYSFIAWAKSDMETAPNVS